MKASTVHDWLNRLGSRTPAPGGGAVAGLNAAVSAATLKMVCEYSTGPKYTGAAEKIRSAIKQLENLLSDSLGQAESDAKAYLKVREAYSLPKDNHDRESSIQKALASAVEPSQNIIDIADKIIKITEEISDSSNPNLVSDIAVSSANAKCALESAIVNLEINKKAITDNGLSERLDKSIGRAESIIDSADSIINSSRRQIRGKSQ